jgi:hypothetical protein
MHAKKLMAKETVSSSMARNYGECMCICNQIEKYCKGDDE